MSLPRRNLYFLGPLVLLLSPIAVHAQANDDDDSDENASIVKSNSGIKIGERAQPIRLTREQIDRSPDLSAIEDVLKVQDQIPIGSYEELGNLWNDLVSNGYGEAGEDMFDWSRTDGAPSLREILDRHGTGIDIPGAGTWYGFEGSPSGAGRNVYIGVEEVGGKVRGRTVLPYDSTTVSDGFALPSSLSHYAHKGDHEWTFTDDLSVKGGAAAVLGGIFIAGTGGSGGVVLGGLGLLWSGVIAIGTVYDKHGWEDIANAHAEDVDRRENLRRNTMTATEGVIREAGHNLEKGAEKVGGAALEIVPTTNNPVASNREASANLNASEEGVATGTNVAKTAADLANQQSQDPKGSSSGGMSTEDGESRGGQSKNPSAGGAENPDQEDNPSGSQDNDEENGDDDENPPQDEKGDDESLDGGYSNPDGSVGGQESKAPEEEEQSSEDSDDSDPGVDTGDQNGLSRDQFREALETSRSGNSTGGDAMMPAEEKTPMVVLPARRIGDQTGYGLTQPATGIDKATIPPEVLEKEVGPKLEETTQPPVGIEKGQPLDPIEPKDGNDYSPGG